MTTESGELQETGENLRWYILHTYAGHEDRVKKNLDSRRENLDIQDRIVQVVVPSEREVSIKDGERKEEQKKLFPCYVLVQMSMDDESWYVVRNTPGVTGFISTEDDSDKQHKRLRPVPLEDYQVDAILKHSEPGQSRVKIGLEAGDMVRIIEGPFVDFIGAIGAVDENKGKVRVLVSFFGRETPVELDFLQVERA